MDQSLHDLALSSEVTNLELGIAELESSLFQIQELRHASAATEQPKGQPSIDDTLIRLNGQLDQVLADYERLKRVVDARDPFLTAKIASVGNDLDRVQRDVGLLKDELSEDKWIVVFRTVSAQATEMMSSLEKVVSACQSFVSEIDRHPAFASTSHSISISLIQSQDTQAVLQQFITLHRSLHAKRKYYDPSTARVLQILDQGIAERSTTNGEVLRRHTDMKARYRLLQGLLDRADQDMQSIEQRFQNIGAPPDQSSIANESFVEPQKTATKHRSTGSKNLLSPGGPKDSPKYAGVGIGRSVSPFRKLANRMSLSSASVSSASSSSPSAKGSRSRSDSAATAESGQSPPSSIPPLLKDRPKINERRSSLMPHFFNNQRAVTSPVKDRNATLTQKDLREAAQKLGDMSFNGAEKPAWNVSVKRDAALDDPFDLLGTPPSRLRPKASAALFRGGTASRPLSPQFDASQNQSPRMLTRPTSPALSQVSSVASDSSPKRRPTSPNSRIPMPSPQNQRRPSGMSDWSRNGNADHTSLLQRTMSPTPTDFRPANQKTPSLMTQSSFASISAADTSDHSELEILDLSQDATPSPSARVKNNSSYRDHLFTPEPMMRAQAARVNRMHRPNQSRMSFNGSRPSTPQRDSRSSSNRPESRAGTSLGMRQDGSYKVNPHDQLDQELGAMANNQLIPVYVERIDLPLTKLAGRAQTQAQWTAQYRFGHEFAKPIQCKLVERLVNGVQQRKVMAKLPSGWQDLQLHLLNLQAQA